MFIGLMGGNIMNRLLAIGFEPVGHWHIDHGDLNLTLERHGTQSNILYAFVCNGQVMYIGKTVQKLASRMQGYKTPGNSQTTNIRNRQNIITHLNMGEAVELYAMPDNGLMRYGGFHLNMAAALEDDLIRQMKPKWNGGKVEPVRLPDDSGSANSSSGEMPAVTDSFTIKLAQTYYKTGFFNVPVAHQTHFGGNGQQVELFVGDEVQPVIGTINRTANRNGSPRIMGGVELRNSIQEKWSLDDDVQVDVLSPTSFRLR